MVRLEARAAETLASSSARTALKRRSPAALEPDAALDRTAGDHLLVVREDGPGHERLHGLAELVVVLVEQRPLHRVPHLRRLWALAP